MGPEGPTVERRIVNITLEQAERVIEAAKAKANDIGVPMTIAVVDTGGNLISLKRMDDAILASLDIAIGKAYTAVAMRMSTADLAAVVQPGEALYNLEIANPAADPRRVRWRSPTAGQRRNCRRGRRFRGNARSRPGGSRGVTGSGRKDIDALVC
jgi:hypothetical protein